MKKNILYQLLSLTTIIAAGLSSILGGTVLVGWYTKNITLIQVFPSFVPMQYNTALGFLICGIGGLLLSFKHKRLAMVCGGIVGTIGFLTLVEYVFGTNLGIDQLFMEHYVTVKSSSPGRMAPNTALCFVLNGLALLIMSDMIQPKQPSLTIGILGSIIIALGIVAFMGYLSGVETAYGWGNLTKMAVHTAIGFIVLGIGVFMYAWREGIVVETTSIPQWFVYPVGISIITVTVALWQALRTQLGTEQVALPLVVLGTGILMAILFVIIIKLVQMLWDRAKAIEQSNRDLEQEIIERKKTEQELVQYRDHLEELVKERTFELTNTNQKLETEKEKAKSANRAKSEFLSNMSHELRTPLNGILGYTQILKRDRGLNTMQMDSINIIHQSGKHLLTLINDILDLSKIEARKMELYPIDVHFQTFIESIDGIIRMRAKEKNVLFKVEIPTALPSGVNVDEKRLRQVLINLLGNAVKFTEQGTVILRVSTLGKWQVDGDSKTQSFRFEVEDNGVGMDPEELEQIFLPFEQVGAKEARQAGTGLGLAISLRLVELMAGELQVKSEKGKGSNFWFEIMLPLVEVAIQSEKISKSVVGYQGQRRTLLVADDKRENRLVMVSMLEPLGFEIVLAENGQEEIDKAKEIQPDLILTDLVMPIKTGFEAVQEIRNIPALKDTPIIAVSASVFDMDQTKSQVMGCNAFLPKPVDEEQLFALLSKYMQLTWVYETQTTTEIENKVKVDEEQPLIAPPTEDLEVLYELAMLGSMREIRDKALQLEELDNKYIPFAQKLQSLAKGFEDEKIVILIEQYLETT
jgi:signal transduction histidine kinase/CheY-like chemotaxis protein